MAHHDFDVGVRVNITTPSPRLAFKRALAGMPRQGLRCQIDREKQLSIMSAVLGWIGLTQFAGARSDGWPSNDVGQGGLRGS